MKNGLFLIFLAFLAVPFLAFSQEKQSGGTDLLLTETTIGDGVGFQYQAKLDNRLAKVFNENGAAALPNFNAFVIVPNIEKTGEKPVDTLPTNVESTFRLRFLVKSAITGCVISTRDVTIHGAGKQASESVVRAMSAIRPTNPEFRLVAERLRQDIRDYFLVKSDSVLLDVQRLLANKQFGEAFVLANSVPGDAPKSEEISKLKEMAFTGYQEQLCPTLTTRFEAAMASETPGRGIEVLATLATDAPCAAEMRPQLAGFQSRIAEPARGNHAWFFNAFSDPSAAKSSRRMTESAMTNEVLTGDGAKLRFVKMRI